MSDNTVIENRDHFESLVKELQTKRAFNESGPKGSANEEKYQRSPVKKTHWLLEEEINTKRESYLV